MRPLLLFVAVCGVLGTSFPARATTMTPLDLPGLHARAELIVAGHVVDSKAMWTRDHDAIFTEVTVRVDRVLAGSGKAGERVVFRREGGVVDGIGMKTYGAPAFGKDEDVVVFLERRGAHRYVVGMAQGKLSLIRDAAGTVRLGRDLSEVAFTRAASASERVLSSGSPTRPRPITTVDELAAELDRLSAVKRGTP